MKYPRAVSGLASLLVAGTAFWFDRVTKQFMMKEGPAIQPMGRIISLTVHHNFGLIANLAVPMPIILVVTSLFSLAVAGLAVRTIRAGRLLESVFLALIFAGAVSNLMDRVVWGFVFDWILLFDRSIINIADIWITVGALGFVFFSQRSAKLLAKIDEEKKTA